MCKRLFSGLLIFSFFFLFSDFAFATSMEGEIKELKARIAELERKLDRQQAVAETQTEQIGGIKEAGILPQLEGIEIGAGATFVVQGTSKANGDDLSENGEDVTDASYSIDLEFEKEFDDYGLAFIHLETGDGAGVEDELQVYSNVNRDADDSDNSVSLTEVWYEHYFKILPISLMVGKIDGTVLIDNNEYANDEATQFLGRIFRNSPTIELPDNAAGLKVVFSPFKLVDIDGLIMDADGDWENIGDDTFIAGQLNLKPNFLDRNGNYRFIAWLSNRDHTEWNNSFNIQEEACGFGICFDQELTDTLGAFARYGWQDPEVYLNGESFSLEHSYSIGLQLEGTLWKRNEDVLGCAFGQIFPSDDYKNANSVNAEIESHLEAYYSFKANKHLTLSPDIQVIWNPYGDDAANGKDTILVGGLRGQVDF